MINKIFESIMGKTMDACIDNMVVKSKKELDNAKDLVEVFRYSKDTN